MYLKVSKHLPEKQNQSIEIRKNHMEQNLKKHILKYSLLIIISKSILFIIGTFIVNKTIEMGILTLAYLSTFCWISIVMIRNFRRNTKLKLTEKFIAVAILFLVNEIWGILFNSVYFIGILGQEPNSQELLNNIIRIMTYDLHILIITGIISVFVNSMTNKKGGIN